MLMPSPPGRKASVTDDGAAVPPFGLDAPAGDALAGAGKQTIDVPGADPAAQAPSAAKAAKTKRRTALSAMTGSARWRRARFKVLAFGLPKPKALQRMGISERALKRDKILMRLGLTEDQFREANEGRRLFPDAGSRQRRKASMSTSRSVVSGESHISRQSSLNEADDDGRDIGGRRSSATRRSGLFGNKGAHNRGRSGGSPHRQSSRRAQRSPAHASSPRARAGAGAGAPASPGRSRLRPHERRLAKRGYVSKREQLTGYSEREIDQDVAVRKVLGTSYETIEDDRSRQLASLGITLHGGTPGPPVL